MKKIVEGLLARQMNNYCGLLPPQTEFCIT
jgi:hypothetical protein